MPDDFNKKLKEWEQIKEGKPNARSSPEVDKKCKKKRKPQEKLVKHPLILKETNVLSLYFSLILSHLNILIFYLYIDFTLGNHSTQYH